MKCEKGYNLENPNELYQFSSDCVEAVTSRWNPIDIDQGRCEVSPKEVFLRWKNNEELWDSGKYRDLSIDARETFCRYTVQESMISGDDLLDRDRVYRNNAIVSVVEVFDEVTGDVLSDERKKIFLDWR